MSADVIAVGPVLPSKLGEAVRTAFRDGNSRDLVEQLEAVLGRAVTGLVVYGSMAGPFPSSRVGDSDVDLLVLVQETASGGIFGRADDVEIDLHVQSRHATLADPITNWIYAGGRVLFDVGPPELEEWLRSLSEWKRHNPDPWTDVDHLRSRVSAQRLVQRVRQLSQVDPGAAALHEARLLATIPTLHAQVKRTRTSSIGHWWPALASEDPEFAEALAAYLWKRSYPPDAGALQRLVEKLYGASSKPAR